MHSTFRRPRAWPVLLLALLAACTPPPPRTVLLLATSTRQMDEVGAIAEFRNAGWVWEAPLTTENAQVWFGKSAFASGSVTVMSERRKVALDLVPNGDQGEAWEQTRSFVLVACHTLSAAGAPSITARLDRRLPQAQALGEKLQQCATRVEVVDP